MFPYLAGGCSDVYTLAVVQPVLEGEVEQPVLFYGVAVDLRVDDEVLETDALSPVFIRCTVSTDRSVMCYRGRKLRQLACRCKMLFMRVVTRGALRTPHPRTNLGRNYKYYT